jgi:hypothetical protein
MFVLISWQKNIRKTMVEVFLHDIFFSFAQIFFFICTIFLFLLFNIFLIFYTPSVCHMPPAHHGGKGKDGLRDRKVPVVCSGRHYSVTIY